MRKKKFQCQTADTELLQFTLFDSDISVLNKYCSYCAQIYSVVRFQHNRMFCVHIKAYITVMLRVLCTLYVFACDWNGLYLNSIVHLFDSVTEHATIYSIWIYRQKFASIRHNWVCNIYEVYVPPHKGSYVYSGIKDQSIWTVTHMLWPKKTVAHFHYASDLPAKVNNNQKLFLIHGSGS